MNIIPEYASVVNRVYTQFLQGLPDPPAFCPAQPDPAGVCKAALGRLAKLKSDPAIALRDPATTMSFCCLSANVIAQSEQLIAEFAKGEAEAFQPLDARGRPLRRCVAPRCHTGRADACFSDTQSGIWTSGSQLR